MESSGNDSIYATSKRMLDDSDDSYGGLIQVPLTKKINVATTKLLSHFDHSAQYPLWYTKLISWIRVFQFLAPALLMASEALWDQNDSSGLTISILSIFAHVIPVPYRLQCHIFMMYIYIVTFILITIAFVFCSIYYSKYTKINPTVAKLLSSVIPIIYVYCIVIAQTVAEYISSQQKVHAPINPVSLVGIIGTILCFLGDLYFLNTAFADSLIFRGMPLQAVEQRTPTHIFYGTLLITLVSAFVFNRGTQGNIIAAAINLFVYITSSASVFLYAEVIDRSIMTGLFTVNFAGSFISITNIIVLSIGKKADSMILFVIIGEVVISYFIASIILRKKWNNDLVYFDDFSETNELPSEDPKKFIKVITTGFNNAHPCCIDYSICEAAITAFPTNITIFTIYAKLVAIYPELNDKLFLIKKAIMNLSNVKINERRNLIQQIGLITKSRETNLDPDVKSMINEFSKEQSKAKTRIRNTWDLILQGNLNEIERSCFHAKIACERAKNKIAEIMQIYPNNRFVARAYAHFHKEIYADRAVQKEWKENMILLQRGIRVVPDCTHVLGLRTFTELPNTVAEGKRDASFELNASEIDNQSDDFFGDEDDDDEKYDTINTLITNNRFPSTSCTIWATVLLFLIAVFIPAILVFTYCSSGLMSEIEPLTYIRDSAVAMQLNSMLASYATRAILENVTDSTTSKTYLEYLGYRETFVLESCDNKNDLVDVTKYLAKTMVQKCRAVEYFSTYHIGNKKADAARELLFSEVIPYKYFLNENEVVEINTTLETAMVRIASQATTLFEDGDFSEETIKSTQFMTILSNYIDTSLAIEEGLQGIVNASTGFSDTLQKVYFFVFIGLLLIVIVAYSVAEALELKYLQRNNRILYRSFSYLPKTVISNISAKFNVLKKGFSDNGSQSIGEIEMNKQEENIIKVFGTISDGDSIHTEAISLIATVITVILAVVMDVIICFGFIHIHGILIESVPHIPYIFATTMHMNTLCTIFYKAMLYKKFPAYEKAFNDGNVTEKITKFVNLFMENYQYGIFGDSSSSPIDTSAAYKKASDVIVCTNEYDVGTNLYNIIGCLDVGSYFYLLTSYANKILSIYRDEDKLEMRDQYVDDFWLLGPVILSDVIMYPLSSGIVDEMQTTADNYLRPVTLWYVILLLVVLFNNIVIILQSVARQKTVIFVLKMFLHCPVSTVIDNPKIMNVINSNYDNHDEDSTSRDSIFFNSVVNKLTDAVIVVKYVDQTIVMTNESFDTMFEIKDKETTFYGKDVTEAFFSSPCFTGDFSGVFKEQTEVKYTKGEKELHLSFSCVIVNGNAIIFGKDVSLRVQSQQLIADERKKSDQMLSSILPASLVPRVQAGEKDISFAVQSVTVTFMDVVEFTPWCGSNTAQHVMSTLNTMFKEFDALVSTHRTMTRVKCIGDCYMAAGGIFDEVNNPSQHAKEVVEFGCEAIKKILEIDDMLHEKLRIRVGINSGGPIVAGVLGTEKPTFEILGPAINIAQQMEHFGVPMQVHISRTVYELIYGSSFNIKERGEIDVKNGKMFTYLVQP